MVEAVEAVTPKSDPKTRKRLMVMKFELPFLKLV